MWAKNVSCDLRFPDKFSNRSHLRLTGYNFDSDVYYRCHNMDDDITLSLDDLFKVRDEFEQRHQEEQTRVSEWQTRIDESIRNSSKDCSNYQSLKSQWWKQAEAKHEKDRQCLAEVDRERRNNAEDKKRVQVNIKNLEKELQRVLDTLQGNRDMLSGLVEDEQEIQQKHQDLERRLADREREFQRFKEDKGFMSSQVRLPHTYILCW